MSITEEQIAKAVAPFQVRYKRRKPITVTGFSTNDPLGVGADLGLKIATVNFKGDGWLTLAALMESYSLVETGKEGGK